MQLDPFEIRLGNYFEYKKQVREISEADFANLPLLLPDLLPIPIIPRYLTRLNFVTVTNQEGIRHFQKYTGGIYFDLFRKNDGTMALYINEKLRLPHIKAIHQLQNLYYELTGDVLKRMPPGNVVTPVEIVPIRSGAIEHRSGPGKYRSRTIKN